MLTVAAKNLMLAALADVALWASLHDGDPDTTGANEITGGTPPYARQPVTWNPPAGGDLDNLANPLFDVPAGADVDHFGLWSAATGGTFYGGDTCSPEHFTNQGTYSLTDIDVVLPVPAP